jgi:hypothetical protein
MHSGKLQTIIKVRILKMQKIAFRQYILAPEMENGNDGLSVLYSTYETFNPNPHCFKAKAKLTA